MLSGMTSHAAVVLLALAAVACQPAPEPGPPLRVYSSNGVKALLEDARPLLELAAGRPIAFEFSTAADLKRRIERGDGPDVVVLTSAMIDELSKRQLLVPDSQRPLARAGVGVGVRTGAPTADVTTPEGLRTLLQNATSVTFTAEGQSRPAVDAAFARLGLVEAMKTKAVPREPGAAPGAVARGESDVVLTLLSEMTNVPGLTVLGPLPSDLQQYVGFAAARRPYADASIAAERLLEALAGPEIASRLARHGLEPPSAR